jgi:hypothetical protein
MLYLHTKSTNCGIFRRILEQKISVYVLYIRHLAIWYILWPLGIFVRVLGMFEQEKSGNPGRHYSWAAQKMLET